MIRPIEAEDIPDVAKLFLAARRETFYWVEPCQFQLDDFVSQTLGEHIWVAERGATLCGFISIWQPENFVHHLYVATEWQGQGVGRDLLAKAHTSSKTPASLKVADRNIAAIAFYHRLGWQEGAEKGDCPLTGPWRQLIMNAQEAP